MKYSAMQQNVNKTRQIKISLNFSPVRWTVEVGGGQRQHRLPDERDGLAQPLHGLSDRRALSGTNN